MCGYNHWIITPKICSINSTWCVVLCSWQRPLGPNVLHRIELLLLPMLLWNNFANRRCILSHWHPVVVWCNLFVSASLGGSTASTWGAPTTSRSSWCSGSRTTTPSPPTWGRRMWWRQSCTAGLTWVTGHLQTHSMYLTPRRLGRGFAHTYIQHVPYLVSDVCMYS